MVGPEEADRWWSFSEAESHTCEEAALGLGDAVIGHGLRWLDIEAAGPSFLNHAEDRVALSRSPRHPQGRFAELRVLAAVQAWNGLHEDARITAELARACWAEEKARLLRARTHYRANIAPQGARVSSVPDLVSELDRLIDPSQSATSWPYSDLDALSAPRRSSPG
jgi:hypothetical protein